jgi:hypothetical protein
MSASFDPRLSHVPATSVNSNPSPKIELFETKFKYKGETYSFKVSAKQNEVITKEQQQRLIEKFIKIFKKELDPTKDTKKINIKVNIQKATNLQINDTEVPVDNKAIYQKKTDQVFQAVHKIVPQSFKNLLPFNEGSKVEHLFLVESHKYTESFFDELIKKIETSLEIPAQIKTDKIHELKRLKHQTLAGLLEKYEDKKLLTEKINENMAQKLWSTADEKRRQDEAAELLNTALYTGLIIAEQAGMGEPAKVHKSVCDAISESRKKLIQKTELNNKINVENEFTVHTDRPENPLHAHVHTFQYGNQITTSMEKRIAKEGERGKFKFYGVNLHTEKATFTPAQGPPIVSTQLRSGSFDFKDSFNAEDKEAMKLALAGYPILGAKELKSYRMAYEKISYPKLMDVIGRQQNNPHELNILLQGLRSYVKEFRESQKTKDDPPNFKDADKELEKMEKILLARIPLLTEEVLKAKRDDYAKLSESGLKSLIEISRTSNNFKDLNYELQALQSYVDEYRKNMKPGDPPDPPNFKDADLKLKKYQMELEKKVSDRVIINNNKSSLKDLFEMAEDPSLESIGMNLSDDIKNIIKTVPGLESPQQNWGMISLQTPVNTLSNKRANPFIRRVALKAPDKIRKALGLAKLNDPDTSELDPVYRELLAYQEATRESPLVRNGLYFNIPTNDMGRFKEYFNQGTVDKARAAKVDKATEESTHQLYIYAKAVLDKLDEIPQRNPEMERYYHALRSLIDQTFLVKESENGNLVVRLKEIPGKKAKYEILGRITILMQMLNFKTTGHCRSGNNRTASWLAKSHQIVGSMASSVDGSIPPPAIMAGKLGKQKKDHWSLKIFLNSFNNSITLQQANKGTRGTKEKIPEISNTPYRIATTRGAFDLAGKFDASLLTNARLKYVRETMDLLTKHPKKLTEQNVIEMVRLIDKIAQKGDKKIKKQAIVYLEKLEIARKNEVRRRIGENVPIDQNIWVGNLITNKIADIKQRAKG